VNDMCVVMPAAAVYCFVLLGALIIAQGAQWSPDYKMWNHRISMQTWRYHHQSFWN